MQKNTSLIIIVGFKATGKKIPISIHLGEQHIQSIKDTLDKSLSCRLLNTSLTFLDIDNFRVGRPKQPSVSVAAKNNANTFELSFTDLTDSKVSLDVPVEKFNRDYPSGLLVITD